MFTSRPAGETEAARVSGDSLIYIPPAVKLGQRHFIVGPSQTRRFTQLEAGLRIPRYAQNAVFSFCQLDQTVEITSGAHEWRWRTIMYSVQRRSKVPYFGERCVRVCLRARVPVTHRCISTQQLWGSWPHCDVSVAMETARAGEGLREKWRKAEEGRWGMETRTEEEKWIPPVGSGLFGVGMSSEK